MNFQTRKLTKAVGRIGSSKARRAQFSPRSKVLRAATSSSSSASSPHSKVAAHEVQASSRVWASPLAAPLQQSSVCTLLGLLDLRGGGSCHVLGSDALLKGRGGLIRDKNLVDTSSD
jgi:hypothetical protein